MNYKVLAISFISCFFLLYYLTIIVVQVDNDHYYTSFYSDSCDILRRATVPEFAVAEMKSESPFTFSTYKITLHTCNYRYMYGGRWSLKYRPIVGDHIHIGIAIKMNGELVTMRDRNLTEPIPYEDFHATCDHPPKYAYIKQWYHTGVHTHCDNIIHIHPWSAPRQLRVTGKDVTLGVWFESVGIEVGSLTNSLTIPGYGSGTDWVLQYFVNVTDNFPVVQTEDVEEMTNLWLVDHHAFIKLFRSSETPPEKSTRVLDYYSKSKLPGDYPTRGSAL